MKNPAKYANRVVQVRGQVSLGFENFTLRTEECEGRLLRVWLIYGGDVPTPTMSTANDLERRAGSVLKVHGVPVPLQRDASLDLFGKRLIARRVSRPDGTGCHGDRECNLYVVTATFIGVFFAASDKPLARYGHLGCCHLLAIEQVADVDAQRTAVPAGGQFACSTDTWKVDGAQAQQLNRRRECEGLSDCQKAATEKVNLVASHWGETLNAAQGASEFLTDVLDWHSLDLLRTYSLSFEYQDAKHQRGTITGAVAARSVCRPMLAPFAESVPIACTSLWTDFHVTKADAKHIKDALESDRETWRLASEKEVAHQALEEALVKWNIAWDPGLELRGCSKPMVVNGDQFSWCDWKDSNSMQRFSIQVTRFGFLRHLYKWGTAPWILTRGDGLACVAENRSISTDAGKNP